MATEQEKHTENGPKSDVDLFNFLQGVGIETSTTEHPEVFTVEAMMPHLQHIDGGVTKNLFLKDKKKRFYLFSARHDLDVKLNDLGKKVGASGGLRFADESILFEKLGVKQGCVTAFALINNTQHDVNFVIDEALVDGTYDKIYFHPLRNSATTSITPNDFIKFAEATGHSVTKLNFDTN